MANETTIVIPRHLKLKVPKMQIVPRAGEFTMRCGNCGTMNQFGVYVKPELKTARITEVVCTVCGKFFKCDPLGRLGGGDFNARKGHEHTTE